MGTEILRPQDCLARHAPVVFPRRRCYPNPNPNPNHNSKPAHKLCRKEAAASPEAKRRRSGSPKQAKLQQKQLVMGEVKILKRGEPIDGDRGGDLGLDQDGSLFGSGPLGPDPAMIPKQIRVGSCRVDAGYAGSAFSISPSPKSLPLPSFSKGDRWAPGFEKSATVVLRRLLRLD